MNIVYVHGFNVADRGEGSVGVLQKRFGGKCFRYGRASLWDVYFANGNLTEALLSCVEESWYENAILVGHSNGCALIHKMLKLARDTFGTAPRGVIYIAPALNANIKNPIEGRKIHVMHSRHDRIVKLSSFLPALIWGRMGNVGAVESHGFKNVDCSDWSLGHSGYFSPENSNKLFATVKNSFDEFPPPDIHDVSG